MNPSLAMQATCCRRGLRSLRDHWPRFCPLAMQAKLAYASETKNPSNTELVAAVQDQVDLPTQRSLRSIPSVCTFGPYVLTYPSVRTFGPYLRAAHLPTRTACTMHATACKVRHVHTDFKGSDGDNKYHRDLRYGPDLRSLPPLTCSRTDRPYGPFGPIP